MKDESYQYTFTVFTATYNRSTTLHRVYDSLKVQTFHDFEWLIIDDGSTDNTSSLVKSWQHQAIFPIRYIWQPNQGKHIAFNRGIHKAQGKLFLSIDSDDACVPEALARFKKHWEGIPGYERNQFSAVTALCKDQNGRLLGDSFLQDIMDSDSLEVFYKYKLKGEWKGFHRTAVLKEFQFPEVKGVPYIPEAVVWHAIAKSYRTRFVNEPLHIHFTHENGQSDHLSRPYQPSKQAASFILWRQYILNNEISFFRYLPGHFFLSSMHYTRYSFHAGINFLQQVRKLNNVTAKILWAITLPFGFIIYYADRILRR